MAAREIFHSQKFSLNLTPFWRLECSVPRKKGSLFPSPFAEHLNIGKGVSSEAVRPVDIPHHLATCKQARQVSLAPFVDLDAPADIKSRGRCLKGFLEIRLLLTVKIDDETVAVGHMVGLEVGLLGIRLRGVNEYCAMRGSPARLDLHVVGAGDHISGGMFEVLW